MKKIIVLTFAVCLIGGMVHAQTRESKLGVDSTKTAEHVALYTKLVKQQDYEHALPAWRYVFTNAPKFQLSTYVQGAEILHHLFAETRNPAYIDTLMMVYNQQMKYFGDDPQYGTAYVLGQKGNYLLQFGKKDIQTRKQAYGYFLKSFEMEGARSQRNTIDAILNMADEFLRESLISQDDYVNLYMKISDSLRNAPENIKTSEQFRGLKDQMNTRFFTFGAADCETLHKYLRIGPETTPDNIDNIIDNIDNIDNLRSIMRVLRFNDCTDSPLYLSVIKKLYQLKPSGEDAYRLAIVFREHQGFGKAEDYLKKAIEQAEDNEAKARYCLRMAKWKYEMQQYPAVKFYAMESLKNNPDNGVLYMLIGKAYAAYSQNYGVDSFDHASVLWAAIDKFNQAKAVDRTCIDEATNLIKTYSSRFPEQQEGFFRGIRPGDRVFIGSWINESTTAHFLP